MDLDALEVIEFNNYQSAVLQDNWNIIYLPGAMTTLTAIVMIDFVGREQAAIAQGWTQSFAAIAAASASPFAGIIWTIVYVYYTVQT